MQACIQVEHIQALSMVPCANNTERQACADILSGRGCIVAGMQTCGKAMKSHTFSHSKCKKTSGAIHSANNMEQQACADILSGRGHEPDIYVIMLQQITCKLVAM